MKEIEIIGTGSYVPENVITNDDLSKMVDTSDEWISTRTGIKERRISKGEETSVLCIKAAKAALEDAKINAEEIDLIIVATVTPDKFTPSVSCMVQSSIGAGNAMCFDINAACTGFMYALNIASQFLKTGHCKTALIIGAETLSKVTDWTDKSTCVLFGDGAGAAVLRSGERAGLKVVYTASDGCKGEFLDIPGVTLKNPLTAPDEVKQSVIYMNGKEVFKFAGKVMCDSIEHVLKLTGYSLEDIKYIVPHQANIRIIQNAAKRLNLGEDKFFINLHKYGNTSAASIAIALDELGRSGEVKNGDKLILVGFGGGLTWGAALIEWTKND